MAAERMLVTGALGCIGAWTVRNLVREGGAPVVFDLASDARRLKLIMTPDELGQVTFIDGDITDLAALERALDEHSITGVIHLAALQVPFCRADPPLGARVNVVGTVNVFEAVARRKERIGRVVYASSIAVYDAADAAEGSVPHGTVGHPTTLYGVYKQANEGTARVYWQDQQVASIGLRPYTVYGPGRDQGLTSSPTQAMLAAAAGKPFHIPFGGRGVYQYADDVARMFIACTRVPFQGAEVFNMPGSSAHMSEIVAAIETAAPEMAGQITYTDKALPFPDEADAGPLLALLGDEQPMSLEAGVADAVERFRALVRDGALSAP